MASTRVTKVYTTTGDRRTYTVSAWVKRSKLGATQDVISAYRSTDGLQTDVMRFQSDDKFQFYMHSTNSAGNAQLSTNRLFRDTNAWYHFVVRVDTTQSTNSDRVRIYVNGVQETSFSTENYMNQNGEGVWGIGASHTTHTIGAVGTANYFDGYVSHIHYADGQSLAPTVFGETDSTTGEWKIKTDPSFTLGTNGFTILKDGNTVTDQSTNSNDFSVAAGTLTKTEDCPSNIFCTWNPLYRSARKDMTLTNGNTFIFEQNSGDSAVSGTIAVSSGKYYWEQKATQVTGTNFVVIGGLHTVEDFSETPTSLNQNNTVGMRDTGNVFKGTSDLGNFTSAVYNGDIFGIAFDADNGSMYFWRNGSALNSGNAIVTGLDMTKTWTPFGVQHGGARVSTTTNFGNGYFQTTAVSSAGTNASGIGVFEYDVPTGYTALSTKGLNE